jgi:hypothetical protein
MWQSANGPDKFLNKARQQLSHADITQSLINAVDLLNREVKRIASDVERLRRDIQVSRRRSF